MFLKIRCSSCRSYLYQNVDKDANLSPIDVNILSWHHLKNISKSKELGYITFVFSRENTGNENYSHHGNNSLFLPLVKPF